jgi:hypothetical protein
MTFLAKICPSNLPRLTKWLHKFFYCNLTSNFDKIEIANIHIHFTLTRSLFQLGLCPQALLYNY